MQNHRKRDPIVIIGTGIAGISVLNEIRKYDLEIPIVVIDKNEGYTYLKPMLSKMCQSGFDEKILKIVSKSELESTYKCTLLANVRAQHINTKNNTVTLSDNKIINFSNLIIASGSTPRKSTYNKDKNNINVKNVSSWKDYSKLIESLESSKKITVIGAGVVGCEVAYDLSYKFDNINLIDSASVILSSFNDKALSLEVHKRLNTRNIELFIGVTQISYQRNPSSTVIFEKGNEMVEVESDIIIECIGNDSSTKILDGKHLKTISIDDACKSEFNNIYALGDCASYKGKVFSNIIIIKKQAKIIADNILGMPSKFNQADYSVIVKVGSSILKTTINVKQEI